MLAPRRWGVGASASFVLEWTPAGAENCLVARMDATLDSATAGPRLDAFVAEDLVMVDS